MRERRSQHTLRTSASFQIRLVSWLYHMALAKIVLMSRSNWSTVRYDCLTMRDLTTSKAMGSVMIW